jgi:hypothetical protein
MYQQILVELLNARFHENAFSEFRIVSCIRTNITSFHRVSNEPKVVVLKPAVRREYIDAEIYGGTNLKKGRTLFPMRCQAM